MIELFKLGSVGIYLFGVTIGLGVLAGLWIMVREAKRKGIYSDKILDLVTYTIIAGIVGARLYYIIAFNFSYYLENPVEIFYFHQGGLSIQGALIGGTLIAFWFMRKNGMPFWKTADTFAPAIIIGQAIGRIGCDVFGIPMNRVYPWGIAVGGQILHPAQLYEVFLNLILFVYLWTRRGKTKYDGQLFVNYIIGFSIIRAIVEIFRSNPIVFGPFTIAHATSFVVILVALFVQRVISKKENLQKDSVANATVVVLIAEYGLIALIGILGTIIYYTVH